MKLSLNALYLIIFFKTHVNNLYMTTRVYYILIPRHYIGNSISLHITKSEQRQSRSGRSILRIKSEYPVLFSHFNQSFSSFSS